MHAKLNNTKLYHCIANTLQGSHGSDIVAICYAAQISWNQNGTLLCALKAKIHYAILVADRSVAGCIPETCSKLEFGLSFSELARASTSANSFEPVCDQDSVMEFGFYIHVIAHCNFTR